MSPNLELQDLSIGLLPVFLVLFLMWRSDQDIKKASVALLRMFIQLLIVGYFLLVIFAQPSPLASLMLLVIMMVAASYLALNVQCSITLSTFRTALISIVVGGGTVLFITTQAVLHIDPWYNPRYLIPLAGMIFAGSMTAISLALERFQAELSRENVNKAKDIAFKAAMIPVVNSLLAVGVVSLPGMMTGQILSGVEPYIAARYQIMVMCMIFSSTGLTVFLFLKLHCRQK